jgi:hypothetical protein
MNIYQEPETQTEIEKETRVLEWNGIKKEQGKRKYKRKYRFFIYQLELIALFQTAQQSSSGQPWVHSKKKKMYRWKQISTNTMTREVSKAKKLAIRSLYILGYDLGMVEISVSSSAPNYTVTKITNKHILSEKMESSLSQVMSRLSEKDKENIGNEPVLGTDIEFVLRHTNGKFALASRYFSKRGKVGYDAIWVRGNRNRYPLVEFRPSPNENPRVLFTNLYRCMRYAIRKINNPHIQWLAGGNPLKGYPIGGHIHFSKISLQANLIRALDNYLTLPLLLMESKESMSRRPKYGYLGDYREQFHGGFEYRTPPSWIVTPNVAKGVLALSKLIAKDYQTLNWMPLTSYDVQREFYQGNRESLYPVARSLWDNIKECPSYNKYQNDIDGFFQLIEKKYIWNEYEDIRKAWRLPPYK